MKRILTFAFASIVFYACKKEVNFSNPEPKTNEIASAPQQQLYLKDAVHERPGARSLKTDRSFFSEQYHKKIKVILFDFDGYIVRNTSWNYSGKDIVCKPAKLTKNQKDQIFATAVEDYSPWNVKVTMDEKDYEEAPVDGRTRVIICDDSWQWYGRYGGVAYINSMFWGDNTPCFVFADLLGNQTKFVAEAATHEAGHTVGLGHTADWSQDCSSHAEYSVGIGTGPTSFCNIEGAGYYKNVVAFSSTSKTPWDCDGNLDQIDLITQALGARADYIGDTPGQAPEIENPGQIRSVLENSNDVDMFEIDQSRVGAVMAISGGNTDIKLVLYVNNKAIATYDDMQSLSVSKRTLPRSFRKHKMYLAVMRSNDDPNTFIPVGSSTGGYTLKFSKS